MYTTVAILLPTQQRSYIKVNQRFFPKFLGNKKAFTRTDFIFDYYHRLWEGAILAFDLHGEFNYGDVPWNMLAALGGSARMRGYYEGRYRDKNLIETQIELRQHIWRRNGIAVWVGAGNVFPSFSGFKWGHTLPNYGIGYRWEFKNRVNVRLDYGFGKKGQSGFLFNINEAFLIKYLHRGAYFWIFFGNHVGSQYFSMFYRTIAIPVQSLLYPHSGSFISLLLILSRKPGITFWALFPLHFIGAFQLVLLYLFGNSIIASDMFLNMFTTNSGEAFELLDKLAPAVVGVFLLYLPALALAVYSIRRTETLTPLFQKRVFMLAMLMIGSGILVYTPAHRKYPSYGKARQPLPHQRVQQCPIRRGQLGSSKELSTHIEKIRLPGHIDKRHRTPRNLYLRNRRNLPRRKLGAIWVRTKYDPQTQRHARCHSFRRCTDTDQCDS